MLTGARPNGAPGVWRVVLATLAEAPRRVRRIAVMLCGNWLLLVMLQLIADFGGGDPAYEILELVGVILSSAGGLLLILMYMLHGSAQETAAARTGARQDRIVYTRMLVALPVFAAAAAAMLGGGLVAYVGRALITPARGDVAFHLAVAVLLLAGIIWALRLIRDSVTFLHAHAAEQSEIALAATEQAARSELQALQAQMNPHFLFNALNTVASLVRTDARTAERTVEHLADVLRRTLDRSRSPHGTVRDEIEYLRSWLAIEQQRWGDRLHVEWDVDDDVLGRSLPPLTLQPLVENALHHGIGARRAGGTIRIAAHHVSHAMLALSVRDDGEGFAPRSSERTGLGNLRRRLHTLYGDRAALDIDTGEQGTTITLRVPATANGTVLAS